MIKEILSSLMGIEGELVIERNKNFEINPNISIINNSDREELNRIVKYGYYVNKIEFFSKFLKNIFLENIWNNDINMDGNKEFISKYLFKLSDYFLEFINNFQNLILEIENEFLKGKEFDINFIFIKISDKIDVLIDLYNFINYIFDKKIKGGELLNLIIEKSMNGNKKLEIFYKNCLDFLYEYFLEDLFKWIFYGKIDDKFSEFFIMKNKNKLYNYKNLTSKQIKNFKKTQENWSNFASIRFTMIPNYLFSNNIAETILFIGKATRVINEKKGCLYCENLLREYYNEIKLGHKNNINFINVIEKIRIKISKEFFILIDNDFNIHDNINFINDFFLLRNDEFFQCFFEESQEIIEIVKMSTSESILNNKNLSNVLLRMHNSLKDIEKLKDLRFKFNEIGFNFINFEKLINLIFKNSINNYNNILRFSYNNRLIPSLWYSLKQLVDYGFNYNISFNFIRNENFSLTKQNNFSIIFILQNNKNIKLSKYFNPTLDNIDEYFCIRIDIYIDSNGIENSELSVLIKTKYNDKLTNSKSSKYKELGKINLTNLNIILLNQEIKNISMIYEKGKFFIKFYNNSNNLNIFECDINLKDYIKLDYGTCYLGIIYENFSENYFFDLQSWRFEGMPVLNEYKNFNILYPVFDFKWPLNLLITSELINNIKMIFTFIFPIKFVYFKLKELIYEIKSSHKKKNLNLFTIKLIYAMKNIFSNFYNNLINYIYIDVIDYYSNIFLKKLSVITNFDDIKIEINIYYNNILNDLFLNHSKIIENITKINYLIFNFCNFYKEIDDYSIEEILININNLKEEFNVSINNIFAFINYLLTQGIYDNYSKFLEKINYNEYYQEYIN